MGFSSKKKANEYYKQYRKRDDYKKKHAILNREWIKNNRERYNASKYIYRERIKEMVLNHYGNGKMECVYCGINDIDVLCLDHINNDGAKQRRKLNISGRGNNSGTRTYEALIKAGYPKGLQILCANCNLKKEIVRKRAMKFNNKFYCQKRGGDPDARHNTSL